MEEIIEFVSDRCPLRIVALTGAGISAESGVPTFRGQDGLWENHRAEDLATPQGFAADPALVWRWYDWRRRLIADTKPNPAHHALADLESHPTVELTVVTQNVDGLHHFAGSEDIIELHGNIFEIRCTRGCASRISREELSELPPCCEHCGALERPGVVWFGEMLDAADLERAAHLVSDADLLLVIGTSAVVYPAAGLTGLCSGLTVEINNAATPFSSSAAHVLRGKASLTMPRLSSCIIEALEGRRA